MTTQEVANRYYKLAQQGNWDNIQDELYAQDCESIEPDFAPTSRVKGMEAIKQKAKEWNAMTEEVHGGYCNEPIVSGNHFSCAMGMDISLKGWGRTKMDEICVFEVKDGKITKEQFFYENTSGQ